MKKEDITIELKQIVEPYVQNQVAFENMTAETSFISDLEINSAHLVDIILDVEDKFDIRIENEEMEQMTTVGASIEIIQNKVS
jgi:acyl carrier protein